MTTSGRAGADGAVEPSTESEAESIDESDESVDGSDESEWTEPQPGQLLEQLLEQLDVLESRVSAQDEPIDDLETATTSLLEHGIAALDVEEGGTSSLTPDTSPPPGGQTKSDPETPPHGGDPERDTDNLKDYE